MKNLKEKIFAFGCAMTMGVSPLLFVACQPREQEDPKIKEEQTTKEKLQAAVTSFDKVLSKMKNGNFTFVETINNVVKESLFDGSKLKIDNTYYVSENGKDYVIFSKDGKWQKSLAETSINTEKNVVFSKFENLDFEKLADKTLIGKNSKGEEVYVNVTDTNVMLSVGGATFEAKNIGSTKVEVPEVKKDNTQNPEELKAQAIQNFESLLATLKKNQNFTYTMEVKGKIKEYLFAGDVAMAQEDTIVYYENKKENGEQKLYEYALEDGKWHKKTSEVEIDKLVGEMTDALGNVIWEGYDAELNILSGECDGQKFEASFNDGNLTLKLDSGVKVDITKVGSTLVKLPENVVDDTNLNNLIWTKDKNGEYQFNLPLMKEVLETYLKNEDPEHPNQYGRDAVADRMHDYEGHTQQIVFIDTNDMSVGVLFRSSTNHTHFINYVIRNLYDSIKNEQVQTKEELKEFLWKEGTYPLELSIKQTGIMMEYSTLDDDYETEHKEEFEGLTKRLFERIKIVGFQPISINDEGTKILDYEGADILFGFRSPLLGSFAGADMGYVNGWLQYYLIEKDDKIGFVSFSLLGDCNGRYDPLKRVLDNEERKWLVGDEKKYYEISNNNLNSLLEPIMTIGEKTKEL